MHTSRKTPRRFLVLMGLAALLLSGCYGFITGGPLITDSSLATGEIVINNRSGLTITRLHISSCRSSFYGPNRLEQHEVIPNGHQRSFTVSVGCWDVKAISANGLKTARQLQVTRNGVRYTVGYED